MNDLKSWAKSKPGTGVSTSVQKADALRAGHKAMDKAEAIKARIGSDANSRASGHAEVAKAHEEAAAHYERAGASSQAIAARAAANKHATLAAKAQGQAGKVGKAAIENADAAAGVKAWAGATAKAPGRAEAEKKRQETIDKYSTGGRNKSAEGAAKAMKADPRSPVDATGEPKRAPTVHDKLNEAPPEGSHADKKAAEKATKAATDATLRAFGSKTREDHAKAMQAHDDAREAWAKVGGKEGARMEAHHEKRVDGHQEAAAQALKETHAKAAANTPPTSSPVTAKMPGKADLGHEMARGAAIQLTRKAQDASKAANATSYHEGPHETRRLQREARDAHHAAHEAWGKVGGDEGKRGQAFHAGKRDEHSDREESAAEMAGAIDKYDGYHRPPNYGGEGSGEWDEAKHPRGSDGKFS